MKPRMRVAAIALALALSACEEPVACYYLMPQPTPPEGYRIAFMIEGDRLSRIDVRADDIVAPGGGRVSEWRIGVPPQVDYVGGCS